MPRADFAAIDVIVSDHPVSMRFRWFRSAVFTCPCGWTARGSAIYRSWIIAGHWADVGSIPMFRPLRHKC
jgi:hypothetical protein